MSKGVRTAWFVASRLFCNFTDLVLDALLNYVEGMHASNTATATKLLPFAVEASWATGRWPALEKYTAMIQKGPVEDFNISIGRALLALHVKDSERFTSTIQSLRKQISSSLTTAKTPSIGACHDVLFKCHVLTELEVIGGTSNEDLDHRSILESLDRRLEVLGGYLNDKQYLLGIRRAAMQLSKYVFSCPINNFILISALALLKSISPLHGLQVQDLLGREILFTSLSTLFFMLPSLEITLPRSSMRASCGKKAIIEKQSKACKVLLLTMLSYRTLRARILRAILDYHQANRTSFLRGRICYLQNGLIVLVKPSHLNCGPSISEPPPNTLTGKRGIITLDGTIINC